MADSPPYLLLLDTLQATSLALSGFSSKGCPERALVVDGDPPWDECCGGDGKGRLMVWGEDLFPSPSANAPFPQPATVGSGQCAEPMAMHVVVQVLRCANSLAGDDEWQDQARWLWEDAWALRRAVCILREKPLGHRVSITNIGPVSEGEEGGCVGIEARFTVNVR